MNEIVKVNKFLLVGDKFMPEMHLKQPGFTYSSCGPFTKKKRKDWKFMQAGNTDCIYKNDLDKVCFQHDIPYGKYKDLAKRTQSDKVLRDKAFKIAINPKFDGYQRGLASMVYKLLIKSQKVVKLSLCQMNNLQTNFINQLLENFKKEEFILRLRTIFGAQI